MLASLGVLLAYLNSGSEAAAAPIGDTVIAVIAASFVVGVAVLFLRVRPFRPDLGDQPFLERNARERAWWTGDPRG